MARSPSTRRRRSQAFEWYIDLIRKVKVTPPSAPTDAYRQIVEGFGRGVTSMYLHNSGSIEEQKKFVGEANFATLPIPVGPAKKRASFFFSETLTMFKAAKNKEGAWKFMTFLMDDEPHFQYCKTLGLLPTREDLTKRPPYTEPAYAGFVGVHPLLHRQPLPGLSRVGRQAGFGGGAPVPAGVRRPAHAEAVPRTSLPRC